MRQGLSAITVVSGYATLDHSRIPDWLSFEDAEMVVKLLNDFLHSAGFIIEDAYDLLRVVETYEGPTLDLTPLLHPNGSTDGHGLPQPLPRPQTRTVGDDEPGLLQMPARLDQARHGDRLGDYRYRPNETVGLASCNGRLGAARISGVDGLIYAEADVDCELERLVPSCPPIDWKLNLTLARHETSFLRSQWVEVAWKNHERRAAYSTHWTDAEVESSYCPSGKVETRGRVYYLAPWPFTTYGSPLAFRPTSTTISGCKKRPGDCTFSTYYALNDAVSSECHSPAPRLRQKKAHFQRCLTAREGGTTEPLVHTSRGLAVGDVDDDGGVDLLVINRDAPPYLLMNSVPNRGNWIRFRVLTRKGRDSHAATVSARVARKRQYRDVQPAASYLSSHDPRVHFGLADAQRVTDVRVRWPDGKVEAFGDFDGGRTVRIQEGTGTEVASP